MPASNECQIRMDGDLLFLAVCFADCGYTSKTLIPGYHRVAEDHKKTTNNTQITQEEVEVEDEAVTESLNDYDAEETDNCVFCVPFENDSGGTTKHSLQIQSVRRCKWYNRKSLQHSQ